MENKNYYVSKDKKKKEVVVFDIDTKDSYYVKPKVKKEDSIAVSKIIFVNNNLSEKIIRKKIDYKINKLLKELKMYDEDESGESEDGIKKSLIDAEKLRLQIISEYVKYLGHTYESLTLKKIQIIIEQLRYKLYYIEISKRNKYDNIYNNNYDNEIKNHRGR